MQPRLDVNLMPLSSKQLAACKVFCTGQIGSLRSVAGWGRVLGVTSKQQARKGVVRLHTGSTPVRGCVLQAETWRPGTCKLQASRPRQAQTLKAEPEPSNPTEPVDPGQFAWLGRKLDVIRCYGDCSRWRGRSAAKST